MKKLYIYLLVILTIAAGCDYLDIVPDETPTEEDAFKDKAAAERYLYSCYSYLPNSRLGDKSLDFFTADEVVTAFEHEAFADFPKGNYTANNPIISYWNTLFQGIRQCYLLLNNIDKVPGMSDNDKQQYTAETHFLIAYYHFLLLKCYGPTLLIKELPDLNTPVSNYPERAPYDECVEWIAAKFDEAIAAGLKPEQTGNAYGRATSTAALAIKGRMMLYAASPLFNGAKSSVAETDDLSGTYADFKNEAGQQLISTTFDLTKWERAAQANLAAIQAAETAGYILYPGTPVTTAMPLPDDPIERTLRLTITDKSGMEIIWGDTRKEGTYDLQNKSTPFRSGASWCGIAPTLTMLEFFYTNNGLPIEDDPAFDFAGRYNYSAQSNGNGNTLNLNQNREPRFNAWIAFHNSYYEINRDDVFKELTQFRKDDNCGIKSRTNNYSPTGYLNKKGVPPLYSRNGTSGSIVDYYWPLARLAELYLNYAEALVELDRLDEAKTYIDKIRTRAGLKGVDESWAGTGITLNQDKMRQIVRQERTIELYLENHRFWDVRRWLLGRKYFNVQAKGMNINGTDDASFFNVTEVNFARIFYSPTHYLLPIPSGETDKSAKLKQNPGY
ncbi:MAG: RagB/SusD family nutrient uptake outer membrane protein [Bacteroidales bacterium]|jgi:hypothetical protein|nr:RagB/SusD family nutrient uptake outer membrane protein [Bacteroidales bacterium]